MSEEGTQGVSARTISRVPLMAFIGFFIYTAFQYFRLAELPWLSDSYCFLEEANTYKNFFAIFDPELVPLRPLPRLYFYLLDRCGWSFPSIARVFPFLLHFGSGILLYLLALRLGLSWKAAIFSVALFFAYPNTKNLAWVAAINAPGRVFFSLLCLTSYISYENSRNLAKGLFSWSMFLIALGFHQSAITLPILCILYTASRRGTPFKNIRPRPCRLDIPAMLFILSAFFYFIYMAFFRENRYHGVRELDALPANIVKASVVFFPEWIRGIITDGFRGKFGVIGFGSSITIVMGFLGFLTTLTFKKPKTLLFSVPVALDLALPVLATGFTQRYAYFSVCFFSMLLIESMRKHWHKPAYKVGLLLFVGLLALDTNYDMNEQRQAGSISNTLLDQARAAREMAGNNRPLIFIDPPDVWGSEHDISFFNWGFDVALRMRGISGPWEIWRTRKYWTNTHIPLSNLDRLKEKAQSTNSIILHYDPSIRSFSITGPH